MIKRGLTLDSAPNITPRFFTNDAAGPETADPLVGAENRNLSPGLNCGLELGSPIDVG
jgi:hypothetical protein